MKAALALQAGEGAPEDYLPVRAAVHAQFPKLAMRDVPGFPYVVGGGLGTFVGGQIGQRVFDKDDPHRKAKGVALALSGGVAGLGVGHLAKVLSRAKTASTAGHVAELIGLGTLAAPSVQELRKKPMSEKRKAQAEVAGLGILAAPYAHDLAKKSKHYAGLASRIGRAVGR